MYRGAQTRGVSWGGTKSATEWSGRWRSCMRICMGIYPHVLTVVMTSPSPVVHLIDAYLIDVRLTVYVSHRRIYRRRASHIGVHLIGVHLKGVHLIGVHLRRASQRRASQRRAPYPLHGQHLVQPKRSLDGKAPYPGA